MRWLDIDTKTRKSSNPEDSWNDTYDSLDNANQYWNNGYINSYSFNEIVKFYKSKNLGYNNTVNKKSNEKESNDSIFDASSMMNRYFGKIANGMVRMSMNGDMAIKTSNGYKTYDVATGALVNCDNFVFDIGSEFFFIIPTNKIEAGDVILAANKPHCVIKVEPNRIEALRYEDGSIVTIVPERNVFMGKTYFYGKIVSMFGKVKDGKGMKGMMKYMIMSEMMKGGNGNSNMNSMLPMMMFINGGMGDMFEGMFDFDDTDEEEK